MWYTTAAQRVWNHIIRKVGVVVEMGFPHTAGYITQEVILGRVNFIVLKHAQYVSFVFNLLTVSHISAVPFLIFLFGYLFVTLVLLKILMHVIFNQSDQRKAIMDSFAAAQRYCMVTTCRRNFLLGYFGEKYSSSSCGIKLCYCFLSKYCWTCIVSCDVI